MASKFFALFSRMKYINRWALMRNTAPESLSQHSLEVAAFAHALAIIGNRRLGKNYNAERAALLGIYHDMPEIITGDMPTPVKYFSKEIRSAFGAVEKVSQERLLSALPEDLRNDFYPLLTEDDDRDLLKLVKAADKLSALVKCIEERKAGNSEFSGAEKSTLAAIEKMDVPEVRIFMDEFMDAYEHTLDELSE
ncbi:MAG: 5'-deoxynucleotidase [Clostridia bacterium]|nr:5'-deoxynucleotidase [Clostridia bacterium]